MQGDDAEAVPPGIPAPARGRCADADLTDPSGRPERAALKPSIVIVEDDAAVREALRTVLELDGYVVSGFESAEELFAAAPPPAGACVILDVNLPGMSGLQALERLRRTAPPVAAIVVSARATEEMRREAARLEARDFLEKPIDIDALLDRLEAIAS